MIFCFYIRFYKHLQSKKACSDELGMAGLYHIAIKCQDLKKMFFKLIGIYLNKKLSC